MDMLVLSCILLSVGTASTAFPENGINRSFRGCPTVVFLLRRSTTPLCWNAPSELCRCCPEVLPPVGSSCMRQDARAAYEVTDISHHKGM